MNINGYARVKLTKTGIQQIRKNTDSWNARFKEMGLSHRMTAPEIDKDGWYRDQLWCILEKIHVEGAGSKAPFTDIILEG